MFDDNRSYRPDEVADKMRVDARTIYRWIKRIERPLPAFRTPGGELRCIGKELNQFVELNRVDPVNE
jgi:excisionase family DNA binding protein